MIDKYHRFHTPCLRYEEIGVGPGELIVCLREAVCVEGRPPGLEETVAIQLDPGTILHADVDLPSIRDAVEQHLNGPASQSEVRFGAGLVLGLDHGLRNVASLPKDQERLIDDWLDRYAIFVFQHLGADASPIPGPPPLGLFNGMLTHWQSHWTKASVQNDRTLDLPKHVTLGVVCNGK